jgi:hypothetical protein
MLSKGEEPGNAAFCDVRLIGSPSKVACDKFSYVVSTELARIGQTAPDCVYMSITPMNMCYMDGEYLGGGHST